MPSQPGPVALGDVLETGAGWKMRAGEGLTVDVDGLAHQLRFVERSGHRKAREVVRLEPADGGPPAIAADLVYYHRCDCAEFSDPARKWDCRHLRALVEVGIFPPPAFIGAEFPAPEQEGGER